MERQPRKSKVPVVYYLSRNGQLEHPHFMEVPLSTAGGLYLRDVLGRLDFLRGEGMASMYSWSSKRSYRNGFVWHDLAEDDFIHPTNAQEYVLKGCELLQQQSSPEMQKPDLKLLTESERRKKASWNSFDLGEYKVYKNEMTAEKSVNVADASTQTEDKNHPRRDHAEDRRVQLRKREENSVTEVVRDEKITKVDGSIITDASRMPGYRTSATEVLMRMISCGSFSLPWHYQGGTLRGGAREMDVPTFLGVRPEGKEYFSGSLVETTKQKKKLEGEEGCGGGGEFCALRRSSSCNADRSWTLMEVSQKVNPIPKQQIKE